jgi:SAM-dependent methyltransferase
VEDPSPHIRDTAAPAYTERLRRAADSLTVVKQAPYRAHIASLRLGTILDLGCGIGRNLAHNGGRGVGIDHNPTSVAVARERGLQTFTPDEFAASPFSAQTYDAILCAHVAEHLDRATFVDFAATYLPLLARGGRFVLITPQQRGFASDPTHVRYIDFAGQRDLFDALGLSIERSYSFPFPAFAGGVFTYNEFVGIARKP